MNKQAILRSSWFHNLVTVALVAIAAGLRIWPLQGLGLRIPYVTFYPAVMISGLYGGFPAGLTATFLSALTILSWSPTGHPFIKDAGDWLGMAVFIVNCTMISFIAEAMLRAQARAKKAQEQAEAANRAKSVFLATMSHELRTPMNAILGFSDLMRNDRDITSTQRENLEIISRSGKHLLNLINDVLDMAKIDAGQVTLELRPFDLGTVVREIAEMLDIRAREKGLQLTMDITPDVPAFIRSDEAKVRQVMVNLVTNAIKYTEQGKVILRMRTRPYDKEMLLSVEVEDTGIGISESDQARIFDPFVQVGNAGAQKGTGLGLSIVRKYVEMMGGSIRVKSALQKGSLFHVELPVQKADESETPKTEAEKRNIVGLEPGQPEYRILIVDDQLENLMLLQRILAGAGFTVKAARNGAEGIELFQQFQPHFIWMDRRMPVMDGIEATKRIRAMKGGKEVKIAAVTASAFTEQRDEILAGGMDDFVRKPFRPSDVFECMERHLGVKYLYETPPSPPEKGPTLSPQFVAGLSRELRRELTDALIVGNIERISKLMLRIEKEAPTLGKILSGYTARFDYLPLIKVLEAAEKGMK